MLPPANNESFGQAVAEIRRAKGLTQTEMVARLSSYYSDESSYRRVEIGTRRPHRDAAIAILTTGLQLTDARRINELLCLAGYEGLTEERGEQPPPEQMVQVRIDQPVSANLPREAFWDRWAGAPNALVVGGMAVAGSLALATLISSVGGGLIWFWMASAILYSALYSVSLLLESAYEARHPRILAASIFVFSFMLLASTIALAGDFISVRAGTDYGLWLSLFTFIAAAGLQWIFVRSALPISSIVKTSFQSHTAQSAHLKNTQYFLVIVIFFWAPPVHAIMWLRRYADTGHRDSVRILLSHWILIGDGVVCPNIEILAVIFVSLLLLSIPMRSKLLDNLKTGPYTNSFTNLFYIRASLYFLLCLLCLIWYATAIASLRA